MNSPTTSKDQAFQRNMMSSFVQIAAVAIVISYCMMIVAPFAGIVIWGVVIATAMYPLHLKLTARLGGSEKLSALVLTFLGLALVILPGALLIKSSMTSVVALAADLKAGSLDIPMPSESIAELPLVGEKLFLAWSDAATDLEGFVTEFQPQLQETTQWLLRKSMSLGVGMLQFAASLIISGFAVLAAASGYSLSCAIAHRISPLRGPHLVNVSIATIRSVTNGVLGVAVIQAVFAGIGFAAMGIPHVGILAGVVLVTAIIQIPALLILAPIVAWVFSFAATVPAIVFAVYMLIVALSDNVLKPLLLGRGVDLPALIVLIGALGGMIKFGVIGLFLGAVIVGIGYEILADWIQFSRAKDDSTAQTPAEAE
jgi:predicted PurR-regulated permease PerM